MRRAISAQPSSAKIEINKKMARDGDSSSGKAALTASTITSVGSAISTSAVRIKSAVRAASRITGHASYNNSECARQQRPDRPRQKREARGDY
ncbi:MAG: hypothetical protein WKF84_30430 [Pyrinomonadaceae bacterium]